MLRRQIEFMCPRGHRNWRSVSGDGPVNIKCSRGCGYKYSVRFR